MTFLDEARRMTDLTETILTRPPRYYVKNSDDLSVSIGKEDAPTEPLPVELVNISQGGATFNTSEIIRAKEILAVKIEARCLDLTIAVAAEVCWVSPAAGELWSLGCKFQPPIPEDVMRQLAEAGIVERREHEREPVSLRATAQWELTKDTTDVQIVNRSRGGFCLISATKSEPGERLQLKIELDDQRKVETRGKTLWQVESSEGYAIGCQFLNARDSRLLSDLVKSQQLDNGKPRRKQRWFKRGTADDSSDVGNGRSKQALMVRHSFAAITAGVALLLCCVAAKRLIPSSMTHQDFPAARIVTRAQPSVAEANARQANVSRRQDVSLQRNQNDLEPAVSGAGITPSPHLENLSARKPSAETSAMASETDGDPSGYRTWTDISGRFRVVARAIQLDGNTLRLRKENGRFAMISLDRLSKEDAQYAHRVLKDLE